MKQNKYLSKFSVSCMIYSWPYPGIDRNLGNKTENATMSMIRLKSSKGMCLKEFVTCCIKVKLIPLVMTLTVQNKCISRTLNGLCESTHQMVHSSLSLSLSLYLSIHTHTHTHSSTVLFLLHMIRFSDYQCSKPNTLDKGISVCKALVHGTNSLTMSDILLPLLLHVEGPQSNGWSFWHLDTWPGVCPKAPLASTSASSGGIGMGRRGGGLRGFIGRRPLIQKSTELPVMTLALVRGRGESFDLRPGQWTRMLRILYSMESLEIWQRLSSVGQSNASSMLLTLQVFLYLLNMKWAAHHCAASVLLMFFWVWRSQTEEVSTWSIFKSLLKSHFLQQDPST